MPIFYRAQDMIGNVPFIRDITKYRINNAILKQDPYQPYYASNFGDKNNEALKSKLIPVVIKSIWI